jgi:hypothetical protein
MASHRKKSASNKSHVRTHALDTREFQEAQKNGLDKKSAGLLALGAGQANNYNRHT